MGIIRGEFTGYGRPCLDSSTTGPQPRLRVLHIPGCTRTFEVRDGSVAMILGHILLWWHEVIHPIDARGETPDDWSYSLRFVRDSHTEVSEHAGYAVDVDATLHPRGIPVSRTFKAWQIAKIKLRLHFYRTLAGVACVGWGGLFHSVVDGMHLEMAEGSQLSDWEKVARRLMRSPRGKRLLAANPGLRAVVLS